MVTYMEFWVFSVIWMVELTACASTFGDFKALPIWRRKNQLKAGRTVIKHKPFLTLSCLLLSRNCWAQPPPLLAVTSCSCDSAAFTCLLGGKEGKACFLSLHFLPLSPSQTGSWLTTQFFLLQECRFSFSCRLSTREPTLVTHCSGSLSSIMLLTQDLSE